MRKRSEPPQRKPGRPVSKDALHRKIADDFRKRMLTGSWPAGTILPSRRSLAVHYNDSSRAVQHALTILKQEGFLGSTPQRRLVVLPRVMRGTDPNERVLELITANSERMLSAGSRLGALQNGIAMGAGSIWAPLHIYSNGGFREIVPRALLSDPLLGVLLIGKCRTSVLRVYESLNTPVVLLDRPKTRFSLHTVGANSQADALDAMARLYALGHRRIAFLRRMHLDMGEVEPDSQERQKGYLRGMKKFCKLDARKCIYTFFPKDSNKSPGVQSIIKAKPAFTAVLASDTDTAGKVIDAARQAGRNVPRDLSVVTFVALHEKHLGFSGSHIDFEKMGREAVLLLKQPKRPAQHIHIPGTWLDGKTTGPARRTKHAETSS